MNAITTQLQIAPTDSDVVERRAEQRTRTLKTGKLIFGTLSQSIIDCLIVDLSPSGARLEMRLPTAIPETVFLQFADGTTRAARRRWTRGNHIGLQLLPK
jgi:PilZ domain